MAYKNFKNISSSSKILRKEKVQNSMKNLLVTKAHKILRLNHAYAFLCFQNQNRKPPVLKIHGHETEKNER